MSSSSTNEGGTKTTPTGQKKYKGVRSRKWGKWVSEIRVPGTQDRLWLGTYSTPEAAAVAHDIAFYCLHGQSNNLLNSLNFPLMLPVGIRPDMSPRTIQTMASDAGMAIDAQLALKQITVSESRDMVWQCKENNGESLSISVDDYLY